MSSGEHSEKDLERFFSRKKETWRRLAELLDLMEKLGPQKLSPTELCEIGELYRKTASHLATLQTFYPRSPLRYKLNDLTARAHTLLYRGESFSLTTVKKFVLEYPAVFRKNGKAVLASAIIFLALTITTALTVLISPESSPLFLPPGVTDSISSGKLWTDEFFSVTPPSVGTSWITTNNITVTILLFGSGIAFGLITAFILAINGAILGAALASCYHYGLLFPFTVFLLPHGVLELTVLFIAGGAGLIMGNSLIDPGRLTRREALKRKGGEALKLFLGGIPILVVAGIVEVTVSPSPVLGHATKLLIAVLLGFVLYSYLLLGGRGRGSGIRDQGSGVGI